jgi:hypothetical protein
MIQIPAIPAAEGISCKRKYEVPIRKTGVKESMGMERDKSEDSIARNMRTILMIFRIADIATAP